MASIPVIVKHQGKRHELDVDPESTGETFKYQLYSITGVEPARQKILVKGGQLKDEMVLSTLNIKPGHSFMMMGTPGEGAAAIQRPREKMKFVEDMTEAEAARQEGATPAGLQNLGNTCYLNSTLQTLRAVPELQQELMNYTSISSGAGSSSGLTDLSNFGLGGLGASMDLTASLRDLYKQMSETQEGFPPLMFLNALRTAFPQFAQKSKTGQGYAQQDAEEAWSQILSQLRQKLKIKDAADDISFVDKYLSGKFDSVLVCDDVSANEEAVHSSDTFLKLDCHITAQTNHLRDGILDGLSEKIEKRSESLGQDTTYTKTSRISRLPKYLTVHFVRFFWKRDAQKKAKIMRKVTFPQELDAVEFCADELKKALIPVRDKIREVRKDEEDVERARKRQRRMEKAAETAAAAVAAERKTGGSASEIELAKEKEAAKKGTGNGGDTDMTDVAHKTDAEIEAERAASILAAKKELLTLVDPRLNEDAGANKTGLYELRGVITHKGASADSGHYTSYVKKDGKKDPNTGKVEDSDRWWWFNDDKVTEVGEEIIDTLSGGGESHSALILLYRAVEIPTVEEVENLEKMKE